MSEGEGVCKYFKENENVTVQREEYSLNKKSKTGCNDLKSTEFSLISETTENNLILANNYKQLIDKLPNYDFSVNYKYGLYV